MLSSRPVIFVSAVSRELRSTRDLVAKTLFAMGYEPRWQDIAPTETGDLRAVLRKWVDESHAVLQIVGHRYGSAPKQPDPIFGPVSYTQYEALYARARFKNVWYILLDEHHPVDCPDDEPADLKKLQADYRLQVKAHHGLYHKSDAVLTTENIVLKLRDDLAKLRRRGKQWAAILLAVLLLAISGIGWTVFKQYNAGDTLDGIDRRTASTEQKVDSVLVRYKQMERALISLADAESRSRQFSAELSPEEVRQRAYTLLEKELGLAAGTLAKELPGFALELYGRPDTSLLMRARAAYALNKFEEAEKLFLESEAQDRLAQENAEQVAGNLRKQRIDALVGAGQSATEQIQYKRALTHYRAASDITNEKRDLLDWADIQNEIGELLILDGQFQEADTHMQGVLKASQAAEEPEHPVLIHSKHLRAMALENNGKHAEAEREHRAVIAIRERVLGPEDWDTLASRNNLANTLYSMGRGGEAEREFMTLLAIFSRVLGPEHSDTLSSRNNLGLAFDSQGKHAEAEKEHRAVLDIRGRVLGPEHPDTLCSRNNLALALDSLGKHVEAEGEHAAVLAILKRVLGPEHPTTLMSRNNLARALSSQRKYTEAEREHRAVLAVRERVLGPEHPDTLGSRQSIANALFFQGKSAEAERDYRVVLAIRERVLGPDHPDTLRTCGSLSMSLATQGKSNESIPLALRALEGAVDLAEEGNPPSQQARAFSEWMRQFKQKQE